MPDAPTHLSSRRRTGFVLGVLVSLALLVLPSLPAQAQSYDLPAKPSNGRPVLDDADMLSASEETRLSNKLIGYADTTSTQIVVVTLPDLGGAPISDYAVALGREWGVGQAGVDNGLVLLVSRDDRKVFIATGYGLEGAVPDAIANRIVDQILTPNFRRGQFYGGIDQALDALFLAAEGEYNATAPQRAEDDGFSFPFELILIIVIFFFSFFGKGKDKNGKRRRSSGIVYWGAAGSSGGFSSGSSGGFGGGGFSGGFGGGSFGGGGAGGSW